MVNLRAKHRSQIEKGFDIIVGIPSFNNEKYVGNVVKTVGAGLKKYLKDMKALIFVCDGGSRDYTREMAMKTEVPKGIEKIVSTYRGLPGKGSAVMAIVEAAELADAQLILLYDADVRSISAKWIKRMARPIIDDGFDYLTPFYLRHKHDGTITNNVVYPIMKGIFGADIRQPIGGDSAIGRKMIKKLSKREDYNHLTARFGIDVWMTTQALTTGKVGQVGLGAKIHAPKEPKNDLTPMFVQVVATLFRMLIIYKDMWQASKGVKVDLISDDFGDSIEEVPIEPKDLIVEIAYGIKNFGPVYDKILTRETMHQLLCSIDFISIDLWAKIVYDFIACFNLWERNRKKLLRLLVPLYLGRAGSFAMEVKDMDNLQAEELIRKNADCFRRLKPYLVERWQRKD